jgi:transcriptional regulator GlxA family with amidase domain
VHFGVVLFPGFSPLDVFGPMDVLNVLSHIYPGKFTLSVLAATLDPVSTISADLPGPNPSFAQSVVPTHTYATAPPLDVLFVPGGKAAHNPAPAIQKQATEFVKTVYPSLEYLVTVCTGAIVVARGGLLDGKRATTNKMAWYLTKERPQVDWVPHARWVVDGNMWTSAGVTAGIDVTLAWISEVYGGKTAEEVTKVIEYDRHMDASWDPFAKLAGL